jgi:hypothetical protein
MPETALAEGFWLTMLGEANRLQTPPSLTKATQFHV